MSQLTDIHDELGKVLKKLRMVDSALCTHRRGFMDQEETEMLEGVDFELQDLLEQLRDARQDVDLILQNKKDLVGQNEELAEKLNKVADENEEMSDLLHQIFCLTGGAYRSDLSWEEACEEASDLIERFWEHRQDDVGFDSTKDLLDSLRLWRDVAKTMAYEGNPSIRASMLKAIEDGDLDRFEELARDQSGRWRYERENVQFAIEEGIDEPAFAESAVSLLDDLHKRLQDPLGAGDDPLRSKVGAALDAMREVEDELNSRRKQLQSHE